MNWKAYNPAWSRHEAVLTAVSRWHKLGLLQSPQLEAIIVAHPLDYYRPHFLVRIALFVLTIIGSSILSGYLGLVSEGQFALTSMLCGIVNLFALEGCIRSNRLYRSGPDNALLYVALGCFIFLLFHTAGKIAPEPYRNSFSLASPYLSLALLPTLALLLLATARYADRPLAVAAYLTFLLLLTNGLLQFRAGRLVLPFALMLASIAVYMLVRRLTKRPDQLYYQHCLSLLKALTLATFYLGGNYLVVREGNAALSETDVSSQIPLAWLFYFFTAGIPVAYILVGLRSPDRIWLLVGLLSLAFSVYTLRYYRPLLPPEIAATLAGTGLVLFVMWVLRYLHTPRHGLSAHLDSTSADKAYSALNLESLVVAQTAPAPVPAAPAGVEFGGGHSGGGGAEGRF
jgi:hypothetical protein